MNRTSLKDHAVVISDEKTATQVEFGVQPYQSETEVAVSESLSASNGEVGGSEDNCATT